MNNHSNEKTNPNPSVSESAQKRPHTPFPWSMALGGFATCVACFALVIGLYNLFNPPVIQVEDHAQLIPNHSQSAPMQLAKRLSPADLKLFSESSNIIADVAEEVAPSVVNIDVKRRGQTMTVSPFHDEFFQRFFGVIPHRRHLQQRTPIIKGNGSGVIISKEGHVLTNYHVVNGAEEIVVTLNDGRKYPANLIGSDPFSDLAVLKLLGATDLKPATLGSSSNLRPGEWVIAIGSPLGFDHTVTLGIISAISRQVPDINSNVEFIQTDAAINPGNSGGPLVNLRGEVVGINTAISGNGQNIGFAIPVNVVKNVSKDLIAGGEVTRPWIGISMAKLNQTLAKSLGLPENIEGVIVAQVIPGSPAHKAGFQQGDIIQRINGKIMDNPKSIQETVRSFPINSTLNVQILRNGQMSALTLKTEKLPQNAYSKN